MELSNLVTVKIEKLPHSIFRKKAQNPNTGSNHVKDSD